MLGPNQQKWVDALRSGKYNQTDNFLESQGSYCCLGVACKVAEENGIDVVYHKDEIDGGHLGDQPQILEWLNMKDSEGKFLINNHITTLTELNDNDGATFEEIANYIEEYADQLFNEPK